MAKRLEERQRAALSKSARLADVAALIEETQQALSAAAIEIESQNARSIDPHVPTDEARLARAAAADAQHLRDRHRAALSALQDKRRTLMESEAAAARLTDYESILSQRDALADDIRTKGAAAIEVLADLIKRLADQDQRIAVANTSLPQGKERLVGAEFVARGIAPNGMWPDGVHQASRLIEMRVPNFARRGMAWPDEDGEAARQAAAYARSVEMQRAARLQREAREASRRWYTVQRTDKKHGTLRINHANGVFALGYQEWPCELYADQLEAAEAAGMIVTPIEPPASQADV